MLLLTAFYEKQVTQLWEDFYKATVLSLSNAFLLHNVPAYYETTLISKNKLSNKTWQAAHL